MALEQKYQYNNKELNNDFGLMWSDYGARWYDPQRGVWGQIDPLAEKYAAWSGYTPNPKKKDSIGSPRPGYSGNKKQGGDQ